MVREVREVGIDPSSHRRFGDGVSYARWEATLELFLASLCCIGGCIGGCTCGVHKLVRVHGYSMLDKLTTVVSVSGKAEAIKLR
jgi:hypothetical protein